LKATEKRAQSGRDWHERRLEATRYQDWPQVGGAPESAGSKKTFPLRTKKPGEVGLANEARPGLGTRGKKTSHPAGRSSEASKPAAKAKAKRAAKKTKTPAHDAEPLGRVAPLPPSRPQPAPREQPPDSLAHEQERDTGVSGHMGGD
jgi:hypothetical protein